MSNLFQRLASQQLDSGTLRVHPMASLPYQAVPEFTEQATELDKYDKVAGTPEAGSAPPGSMPSHPTSESVPTTSRKASTQPQHPSAPAPLLPTTDQADQAPMAAPSTEALASEEEPHTGITPHPAKTRLPLPSPLLMELPAEEKPGSAVSNEISPPVENPSTDTSSDTAADGLPAAILPRQRAAKATTAMPHAPPTPHTGVRTSQEASSEPNEVHVHIGRIEVTAIQQPSPPKPRQKRGRAPMSLDDYLAKRQRGDT
jgi:hypothetical protein